MDILMCVTKLREEEKLIIEKLNEKDINVRVILDSMSLPMDDIFSGKFELAIIRCLSQIEGKKRAHLIESAGLKTLNSLNSINICTNKIIQALLFHKDGVPQPDFSIAFTPIDLKNSHKKFGDEFLIKPATSSWGRGISLIENNRCLETWIAARESLDVQNKEFPVLTQEFINKGDFDIRVVIVGEMPIVAFKRVSEESWRTNTHLGASVIPISVDYKITELVEQTLKSIGPGIYGLDLLYDFAKEKYVVCEINQNPEFAQSSKVHRVDIPSYIADYVHHVIQQKRKVEVYG